MRTRLFAYALAIAVVGSPGSTARPQAGQNSIDRSPRTQAEFEALYTQVSNWGRWGKDDQLGSLNLITDAKRKQAAALVKTGIAVSMSHNPMLEKAADNLTPFESEAGTKYSVSIHSTGHSHLDALCNTPYMGKLYMGRLQAEVRTPAGCTTMGVETIRNGVTTRGILIDIPRLKGVPYLEPGTPVFPEDIEAWEKKAGLKVSAGDAVFLRTGRWARRQKLGPWCMVGCPEKPPVSGQPGWHASVVPWFKNHDVAIVGADVANDVVPSGIEGILLPVHALMIGAVATPLVDALDLENLAETAARLKRWEFMLTGAPLAVPGGTGSPINLIALF